MLIISMTDSLDIIYSLDIRNSLDILDSLDIWNRLDNLDMHNILAGQYFW